MALLNSMYAENTVASCKLGYELDNRPDWISILLGVCVNYDHSN